MRPVLMEPRELSGEVISSVLELVGVKVTPEQAGRWTRLEQLLAYDWAWREHLSAADNPVQRRPKPRLIELEEAR
jgi:hypothetical protein